MPRHPPYALISLIVYVDLILENLLDFLTNYCFCLLSNFFTRENLYYLTYYIFFFTRFIPIYAVVNVQSPTTVGLVGSSGLEPPTSRLSGVCSNQLSYEPVRGGDERDRTADPLLARQVLSQLSYTPILSNK